MKFYSFEDIKQAGDCRQFVTSVLGLPLQGDRCQASWRGGDGYNVALDGVEWYDHKTKAGGGLVELCAIARYGGDVQQAQEFLGGWLGLTPTIETRRLDSGSPTHYEELLADGYQEVCRYDYRNLAGNIVHTVVRMKNPITGKKEFLQRTPAHWGLGDVKPILYNLAGWIGSSWVLIPEGEKDVETCIAMGLPATTNSGGATKWRPEFNADFTGTDVVILRDNDEAGMDHARTVCRNLAGIAKSLRIMCPSKLPKGDVTDWVEQEGGTKDALMAMMLETPEIQEAQASGTSDEWAKAEAKKANTKDFTNSVKVQRKDADGGIKVVDVPRQINDLITECHQRFLGFPRRLGDNQLFDHNQDTKKVEFIHKPSSLFAWIAIKSKHSVYWSGKDGCVSKEEFFEGLTQTAVAYQAYSYVPDWPNRRDVFYAHDLLPAATPDHRWFNGLVNFFIPANETYRSLLRAFFCAPLYYIDGVKRPAWVIDSITGAGAGKTTLVEMLADLFAGQAIKTSKRELAENVNDLIKRVVSSDGRAARILLVDNVKGDFSVPEFADMVTARSISGKAPYGRGEEVRPNNLTYVITVNSANLDNDIASRSYYINVKQPEYSATWTLMVLTYIREHRLQIFADMLDMLSTHVPFADIRPVSRFPEFETSILQACCTDIGNYSDAAKTLLEARQEANVEEEQAKQIEEALRFKLADLLLCPDTNATFIRSDVIQKWLAEINRTLDMQTVRNLAKQGMLRNVHAATKRFPEDKDKRRSGIMWMPENADLNEPIKILGLRGQKVEVVDTHSVRVDNGLKKLEEDI